MPATAVKGRRGRAFSLTPEVRRRLRRLVGIGFLLVVGAFLLVRTPGVWEYRLRHMDADTLALLALERPGDALVFYYLGTSLYNEGRFREAAAMLERALQLKPRFPRAALALGLTYMAGRRPLQAHEVLQRALEMAPNSPEAHFALGMLYLYQFEGAQPRAAEQFQAVCRLQPWNAEAWYYYGLCQEAMGFYPAAIEAFQRALRLRPFSVRALRELGFVLTDDKKYGEAALALQKALELEPEDPYSHYLMAHLALQRSSKPEDLALAEREAKRALELGFVGIEPFALLGEVAFRRQEYGRAKHFHELCLRLMPRAADSLYRLALIHQRLNQPEKAKEYMERYARLREVTSAIQNTIDRIKMRPEDLDLRLRLARLFVQDGDYARAINQYEYYLSHRPQDEGARRELEALRQKFGALASSLRLPSSLQEEPLLYPSSQP